MTYTIYNAPAVNLTTYGPDETTKTNDMSKAMQHVANYGGYVVEDETGNIWTIASGWLDPDGKPLYITNTINKATN